MPEQGPGPRVLAWGFAFVCVACSSDVRPGRAIDAGDHEHEGGPPKPAPAADASPSVADSGAPAPVLPESGTSVVDAAPPDALANGSFDTAKALIVGDAPLLQDVVKAYQESYFTFEGKAGSYYSLSTDIGPFTPDNVVSLYGPDRVLIAENDEGGRWPNDRIDARLVVHLPSDGTYYVKVVDPFSPPEAFPSAGFSLVYYHVAVAELVPGTDGVGVEDGAVRFAKDATSGYSFTTLIGEFRGDADGGAKGVFAFSGEAGQALIGRVLASGVHGNGSTAHSGRAEVFSKDGSVLAGIDRSVGQAAIHPPIGDEEYTLRMIPSGELGENGFYAVDLVMLPDNPAELASSTNGALAGAEAIDMIGARVRRGLILSVVDTTDVDYFSFEVRAGESGVIGCEGESAGSGIHTLHAEVRDGSDAVVASADETVTENLYIEPFEFPAAGTHYLRLSSTATQSPRIVPWVRCSVNVGP
jgi:hypothetical protein